LVRSNMNTLTSKHLLIKQPKEKYYVDNTSSDRNAFWL
jgi:hypothetical protein